ncbi:MAG: Rrf2 family transcriptional regulator [Deltaproteobacteria bacterium]|jgi:Rrf2 family protein|nr:Rrf2 family transcriptional regulator [Deltaproteobacteria bacterium]MBW2536641.1 Rrf2 family transcriptional regulator [Deltaproteobacteria bacterium]
MINKSTEAAIAAMSLLAEAYDGGKTTLKAADIAEQRSLQKPFVAKLLTQMSQAGLIHGTPGRRGGYTLARPPRRISLLDIADCFERKGPLEICPFGPAHCGNGPKCPLHDDIVRLRDDMCAFLKRTTLDVFRT